MTRNKPKHIQLWLFIPNGLQHSFGQNTLKKKFDDTDIIVVPWPILCWRFTENQGLLVSVQPVCVFQPYKLLLQQYFWLTVKYILLNYLKTFIYIHMADKSQAFLSVHLNHNWRAGFYNQMCARAGLVRLCVCNLRLTSIAKKRDFDGQNYYEELRLCKTCERGIFL